jgi:hypothetical protein
MSSTPEVVSVKEMDKKRKENIKEGSDERGHWRWCECTTRVEKEKTKFKPRKRTKEINVQLKEWKIKSGN